MTQTRNVRGIARERAILDAATRLFGSKGFRSVSLREVAAAAGITHPTLLHYFPSKEILLDAVLAEKDLNVAHRFTAVRDNTEVVEAFHRMKTENLHDPEFVALLVQLTAEAADPAHPAHEQLRHRYEDVVKSLDNLSHLTRPMAPGLDAVDAARLLVAVSDGLNLQWMYAPDDFDPVALATRAAELILDTTLGTPARDLPADQEQGATAR